MHLCPRLVTGTGLLLLSDLALADDDACPSRTGWVVAGAIVFVLGLALAFFVGYYVGSATVSDSSAARYYASNARPLLQDSPRAQEPSMTSPRTYTSGDEDDDETNELYIRT